MARRAGPAALFRRLGLSAARPHFRALFAASVGHAGPAPGRKPAAARTGAARLGRRVRAGRGQTDGNARLSDRLGARSLACRFRAARRDALVRRPRGRDQADLGLFLPRHERQSARAYFRTRLWQRAGYCGVHAGRRTQHLGQGRLEGLAGRAGLPARCAGLGLPRILHRAGAGLQRLSLQSHPRRPDAARPPARDLRAGCDVRRGGRGARRPAQSLRVARAERHGIARRGGKARRIAATQGKKTNSKTSSARPLATEAISSASPGTPPETSASRFRPLARCVRSKAAARPGK